MEEPLSWGFSGELVQTSNLEGSFLQRYEEPRTKIFYPGPVLNLLSELLAGDSHVEWPRTPGIEDETNLNSFNSSLNLSWTRDCLEGVEYFSYLLYTAYKVNIQ